mmetsp:Transcript_4865/g.12215  ORF Transcript_4865/g.12215 Transcript_4865/m.12215 type:complete len:346 (-) Transcript_4865:1183-2220(-)
MPAIAVARAAAGGSRAGTSPLCGAGRGPLRRLLGGIERRGRICRGRERRPFRLVGYFVDVLDRLGGRPGSWVRNRVVRREFRRRRDRRSGSCDRCGGDRGGGCDWCRSDRGGGVDGNSKGGAECGPVRLLPRGTRGRPQGRLGRPSGQGEAVRPVQPRKLATFFEATEQVDLKSAFLPIVEARPARKIGIERPRLLRGAIGGPSCRPPRSRPRSRRPTRRPRCRSRARRRTPGKRSVHPRSVVLQHSLLQTGRHERTHESHGLHILAHYTKQLVLVHGVVEFVNDVKRVLPPRGRGIVHASAVAGDGHGERESEYLHALQFSHYSSFFQSGSLFVFSIFVLFCCG